MTEYHTEDPTVEGWYRVWELVSGYSFEAYWDNDLKKWIMPKDFEEIQDCYEISYWCEVETN